MTSLTPDRPAATRRISPTRIVVFSLFLFVLIAIELYASETSLSVFHEQLLNDYTHTEEKGWQKTVAWLVDQLRYWLPFLTVCIFQYAVYRKHNSENGICQKEMAWQVGILTVLVYGGLLPYVAMISRDAKALAISNGETLPTTEGGVEITILMKAAEWFIRVSIPLLLLLVYHATCGKREAKEAPSDVEICEEATDTTCVEAEA